MSDQVERPFRILVVCTGNVCRSPQAERLLRAEFERRGLAAEVEVASAGVAALVGRPMTDQAAAQTVGYGGNPGGHLARRLEARMIGEADLVLTMERGHRADVVRLLPRASRFAFTLPEFVRLATELRDAGAAEPAAAPTFAGRFRALVPQVAIGRGMTPPVPQSDDEIEDPYGRSDDVYARSGRGVSTAVTATVALLVELAATGP